MIYLPQHWVLLASKTWCYLLNNFISSSSEYWFLEKHKWLQRPCLVRLWWYRNVHVSVRFSFDTIDSINSSRKWNGSNIPLIGQAGLCKHVCSMMLCRPVAFLWFKNSRAGLLCMMKAFADCWVVHVYT